MTTATRVVSNEFKVFVLDLDKNIDNIVKMDCPLDCVMRVPNTYNFIDKNCAFYDKYENNFFFRIRCCFFFKLIIISRQTARYGKLPTQERGNSSI